MSPAYLKTMTAALAVLSSTSLATPVDTDLCSEEASTTTLSALPLLPVPTPPLPTNGSSCSTDASRDFSCAANATTTTDTSVFKAANCAAFSVECGVDRIGGDLPGSPQYPGSFGGCVDVCANTAKCVAVVYSGGPCYLKAELAATAKLAGATGAKKVVQSSASASAESEPAETASSSVAVAVAVVWTTVTATPPEESMA